MLFRNYLGSLPQTVSRAQISTMSVKDNLMVAGGFLGSDFRDFVWLGGDGDGDEDGDGDFSEIGLPEIGVKQR